MGLWKTGGVHSVIVQLTTDSDTPPRVSELGPGGTLTFGRGTPQRRVDLVLSHEEVPRLAGRITAVDDHWTLTNLTRDRTLVVENPEGGDEHVKVGPRRAGAPIPFELARLLLPVRRGRAELMVYAPGHTYLDAGVDEPDDGIRTAAGFHLDEAAKYFLVLTALCEPQLRDLSSVAVPTVADVIARLAPLDGCHDLTRSAVNFHVDYLVRRKLRLEEHQPPGAERLEWKRNALVAFATRFDIVREEHLDLLPPRSAEERRAARR